MSGLFCDHFGADCGISESLKGILKHQASSPIHVGVISCASVPSLNGLASEQKVYNDVTTFRTGRRHSPGKDGVKKPCVF